MKLYEEYKGKKVSAIIKRKGEESVHLKLVETTFTEVVSFLENIISSSPNVSPISKGFKTIITVYTTDDKGGKEETGTVSFYGMSVKDVEELIRHEVSIRER